MAGGAVAPAGAHGAGDGAEPELLAQSDDGGTEAAPPLTDEPQTSDPEPRTNGSPRAENGSDDAPRDDSAGPPKRLPDTGAEPGAAAAVGLALVLLGIGLRLRTADVRG